MFDLSILKNIDFTDKDNLIFIAIVSVMAVAIFYIFILVVKKIIRLIITAVTVSFNLDVKKPKFDKKNSTDWLHQKSNNKIQSNNVEKPLASYRNLAEGLNVNEKISMTEGAKEKSVEQLSELKKGDILDEIMSGPKPPLKPGLVREENTERINLQTPLKNLIGNTATGSSIFGNKKEVSRTKLEYEMRKDPKIWQAAKDVGLDISQTERSKLVKDVFSQAYGRNISKSDVKWGIKKLNQKMLDAKTPAEHAKIRKEINFFKKIGGL